MPDQIDPTRLARTPDPAQPVPAQTAEVGRQEYFFLNHLQSIEGDFWYLNQRFLGRGGNGTTFLVTCTSGKNFGLQFALKVLHRISDERRVAAFRREVEHLREIDHPAIVRVFDEGSFTTQDGRLHPFVVMEYVPSTLRQLINVGEVSRLVAVRFAMHCLSALQYIHSRATPVIHRDLKPENILISGGVAKLADFGLSKPLPSNAGIEGRSEISDELGAAAPELLSQWPGMPYRYKTPELLARARGERVELTTATDIFQFGTVLYELITGFNPQVRQGETLSDIELDVREIRGAGGEEITRLIRGMLDFAPANRPTALACLQRLNIVHKRVCEALSQHEGQGF